MAINFEFFRLPSSIASIATISLLVLLFIAAGFDVIQRRIPNALIITGVVIAAAFASLAGFSGIGKMAAGLLAALVVLLPVYASGLMGAGDVKLISLVGSFLGLHHFLFALLCIFAAGGLLAVFFMLRDRKFVHAAGLPYGVAILSGVAGYSPFFIAAH
jgi:prepilin peptidase CpaA